MSYNEPPNYGTPPPPPPPGGGYGAPGGYGGAPYGGPPAGANHPRGTLILVLGILSIVCCGFFTGIPAIVMGKKALDESRTANYANAGLIKAGWICGIIGTVLSILGAIFQVILVLASN